MPKYVIEREYGGAGDLTTEQLRALSAKAVHVAKAVAPDVQWLQSFVAHDKIYCVYVAPDEQILREISDRAGLPTHRVSEVKFEIDPSTAER